MLFKRFGLFLICFLLFAQMGCLNDKPKIQTQIGLGDPISGCLSQFDIKIRNYFNGRSNYDEISGLFDCSLDALDLFKKRTRSVKPGEYRAEDLRFFLNRYFLSEKQGDLILTSKQISPALLKEAMVLKQVILGGGTEAVSSAEIDSTIELLKRLKKEAIDLLPYMPLDTDHFNELKGPELEIALQAMKDAGQRIGSFLVRGNTTYTFERFEALLFELQEMFEKGTEGRGPRILRDNLEVFGAAKKLIFSGSANSILPEEWPRIATLGSAWYALFLRFSNLDARRFIDKKKRTGELENWFHGLALRDFMRLSDEAQIRLHEMIRQHQGQVIPFEDMRALFQALTVPDRKSAKNQQNKEYERLEAWRPLDLELSTYLQASIKPLITRVLGGYEINDQGRDAEGLTPAAITRVWTELRAWFGQQLYIEKIFLTLGGEDSIQGSGFTREEVLSVNENDTQLRDLSKSFLTLGESKKAVLDIRTMVQKFRPFFPNKEEKIYFPDDPKSEKATLYSFHNLSQLNWIRSVGRVVLQGYVKDQEIERARSYGGITEDEIRELYWDFRELGVRVGILDPTSFDAAEKRFKEANLFTSVADGGEILTLDEGVELFSFLLSAGGLSNKIHTEISETGGCKLGSRDRFDRYPIEISCYRKNFMERFPEDWDHMPAMAAYFKNLDPAGKNEFMKSLETAGRKGGFSNGQMIDKFETDVLVMILHYVEATFLRHDLDHSGAVSTREAIGDWLNTDDPRRFRGAFPIFRQILLQHPAVKAAKLTKDEDLEAVFTFLLKNGKPPEPFDFLSWKGKRKEWDINADRGKLLQIFSNLSLGG